MKKIDESQFFYKGQFFLMKAIKNLLIIIMPLPNNLKIIYDLFKQDNLYKDYDIDDIRLKKFKDKDLNIYRWDKILNSKIDPNHFYYYYKDHNIREKLQSMVKFIKIKEKINENEWIEEIDMYEKILHLRILCLDYQILMCILESDSNATFQLFSLMIRQVDNRFLIRLEIAFNMFDFDQEVEIKNQINLINTLERIILTNLNKK
jgi:hypothetical protein